LLLVHDDPVSLQKTEAGAVDLLLLGLFQECHPRLRANEKIVLHLDLLTG
jgi:hypothetical protein